MSRGRRLGVGAAVVAMVAGTMMPARGAHVDRLRSPTSLRVDAMDTPLGVAPSDVHFGWRLSAGEQSAYQVVITTGSGDPVWDSGRVGSPDQTDVAYRGPVLPPDSEFAWTVRTWDASGRATPYAPPTTFLTGLDDTDWQASWIRRTTPNPVSNGATDQVESGFGIWQGADEYTYARKEATLDASPIVRATGYVAADQKYELYVNGAMVAKGSPIDYPDAQPYETIDLTRVLEPGTANAIGVIYNWQGPGKGRPQGSPGVIVQISITYGDGHRGLIATDGTWKVLPGAWLPSTQRNTQGDPVDYTETINGLGEPSGWDRAGYVDALWQRPVVLGRPPVAPWTHLVPSRTRVVTVPVHAVSLSRLSSGAIVADFGEVVAASPAVTFRRGVPGRLVTMHAGYVLDGPPPSTVSTTKATQGTDMSYGYIERGGGAETFRAFDYLGFRYVQVDNPGEPLDPGDVVAWARHTEMPADATATFSSSNATVDAVYRLAAHSALFTSQEEFIDTPTREKGPFLRDGFNESQTVMAAFGDHNLTRASLLRFARSQARYWPDGRLNAIYPSGEYPYVRDIPDFTEIYPEWVWQYWLRTGDRDLLATVYPVVLAIAGYVARAIGPSTGLVTDLPGGGGTGSAYNFGLVDWPPSMRYGYDMSTAARTTVNMLAVDAFDRAAAIAVVLGRPDAPLQSARAASLRSAINRLLTRPDGIYVDGLDASGAQSGHASQHANAYAIAYRVAPSDRVASVAAYAASLGMAMGPQTVQALLDAFRLSGRTADLVRLVTDRSAEGWARILAAGGTFTWEDWTPSDADGDSMSHGWGSTVLVALQETLLGVTPTGPGFATFDVAPPTSGIDSVSGSVPTPRGSITVAWDRRVLKLRVPPGTTATVHLATRMLQLGPGAYELPA